MPQVNFRLSDRDVARLQWLADYLEGTEALLGPATYVTALRYCIRTVVDPLYNRWLLEQEQPGGRMSPSNPDVRPGENANGKETNPDRRTDGNQ